MKRAAVTYRNEKKIGPYVDALKRAGIEPVLVTPKTAVESLGGMGLALTGGTDLDPALYGERYLRWRISISLGSTPPI